MQGQISYVASCQLFQIQYYRNTTCNASSHDTQRAHLRQTGETHQFLFSFVGLFVYNAATPFSVSEFLRKHETEFFSVIDARLSLLRLKRKGVISQDVETRINAATDKDAQEILYDHMTRNANVDALKEYCEVAIDADGFPNMQALGRKMKEELQQGQLGGAVCVPMCVV